VSSMKSPNVVRSTVADTWRWMWPDLLMRILPMAIIPFIYIAVFHLPLAFLGLVLNNVPQQLAFGLLIGIFMAAFAATYRMAIVGPWFRWPTLIDHIVQGAFYLFINGPIEELFFRGFVWAAVTQWTGWLGWGWLVSTAAYILYHRLGKWSCPGRFGLQLAVSGTAYAALIVGGGHCAWLYYRWLPQLGRRSNVPPLEKKTKT